MKQVTKMVPASTPDIPADAICISFENRSISSPEPVTAGISQAYTVTTYMKAPIIPVQQADLCETDLLSSGTFKTKADTVGNLKIENKMTSSPQCIQA